jgi:hypothetical protein
MRNYLIGAVAGLVGAMAFASVASADVTALRVEATATPSKQDKKVRGPVNVYFESNDSHAGTTAPPAPCLPGTVGTNSCYAFPPSIQARVVFPTDFRFDPGNLVDCNLAALIGKGTAAARASCPRSVVGVGQNKQLFSDGRLLTGTITAFNGAPSGGNPSMYLHIDIPGVESKPILNGVISGNVLNVQIPPVQGSVIEQFFVTVNGRTVVGTSKAKKGSASAAAKRKKRFYLTAKCSKRDWTTTETVTYQNGKQLVDSVPLSCTQKKKKKK